MTLSPLQIVATIASRVNLSKLVEDAIYIIVLPVTAKYNKDRDPQTDEEFMELMNEWDGDLTSLPQIAEEHGDFGVDSEGTLHVLTPSGWHPLSEMGPIEICPKCYSDDIFTLEWVNINTKQTDKEVSYEDNTIWCKYCNESIRKTIQFSDIRKQGEQHGDNTSELPKDNA